MVLQQGLPLRLKLWGGEVAGVRVWAGTGLQAGARAGASGMQKQQREQHHRVELR